LLLVKALIDFDAAPVFGIPLLDGTGVREGMLIEGPQGWGEFSPSPDGDARETARWLTAAIEGGTVGWPDPLRGRIAIAVSVPAVGPAESQRLVEESGCLTAEVAVGLGSLADDVARVEAVREALGPGGRIRLGANAVPSIDAIVTAVPALQKAAGELEFLVLPGRTVDEVAAVRRQAEVRIAAEVSSAEAADVAVLRSGPLGGVRRGLRVAERLGVPCVVSSSGETSIGLASGLALAGALPELPFACALGTVAMLAGDVVARRRSLRPVDGHLPVAPMPAMPEPELLRQYALTDAARIDWWRQLLRSARTAA
jgi:O-succinylbenzoate synthase